MKAADIGRELCAVLELDPSLVVSLTVDARDREAVTLETFELDEHGRKRIVDGEPVITRRRHLLEASKNPAFAGIFKGIGGA